MLVPQKRKGNEGEAHVTMGVLERNSWPIQRREFKEESLKNLKWVQRRVCMLRC